jgi:hypothetical protein
MVDEAIVCVVRMYYWHSGAREGKRELLRVYIFLVVNFLWIRKMSAARLEDHNHEKSYSYMCFA